MIIIVVVIFIVVVQSCSKSGLNINYLKEAMMMMMLVPPTVHFLLIVTCGTLEAAHTHILESVPNEVTATFSCRYVKCEWCENNWLGKPTARSLSRIKNYTYS